MSLSLQQFHSYIYSCSWKSANCTRHRLLLKMLISWSPKWNWRCQLLRHVLIVGRKNVLSEWNIHLFFLCWTVHWVCTLMLVKRLWAFSFWSCDTLLSKPHNALIAEYRNSHKHSPSYLTTLTYICMYSCYILLYKVISLCYII